MIKEADNAEPATRLLMLGMTPKTTPANNSEYGELLQRFSTDPDFRDLTKAIARGMGVQIYTDLIAQGLMLVPDENGFFAPSLDNFRRGMRFRERVAYGLLHFILGAYVFPSEEALNDDLEVLSARIRPVEVARYAVQICEALKSSEESREVLTEEMTEGYIHILSLREGDLQASGQQTVVGMVRSILDKYEDEGLFTAIEENGERAYRSRPQFRIQVRFMVKEAEHRLWNLVQQAAAEDRQSKG